MPAEPLQGRQLVPPLTGVIDDIGLFGDEGRVILILKLETPITDERLQPARMGKRTTVLVTEDPGTPHYVEVTEEREKGELVRCIACGTRFAVFNGETYCPNQKCPFWPLRDGTKPPVEAP